MWGFHMVGGSSVITCTSLTSLHRYTPLKQDGHTDVPHLTARQTSIYPTWQQVRLIDIYYQAASRTYRFPLPDSKTDLSIYPTWQQVGLLSIYPTWQQGGLIYIHYQAASRTYRFTLPDSKSYSYRYTPFINHFLVSFEQNKIT